MLPPTLLTAPLTMRAGVVVVAAPRPLPSLPMLESATPLLPSSAPAAAATAAEMAAGVTPVDVALPLEGKSHSLLLAYRASREAGTVRVDRSPFHTPEPKRGRPPTAPLWPGPAPPPPALLLLLLPVALGLLPVALGMAVLLVEDRGRLLLAVDAPGPVVVAEAVVVV